MIIEAPMRAESLSRIENKIRDGLEKVMSIIDGSSSYDSILGNRIDRPDYIKIVNSSGLIEAEKAIAFFEKRLESAKVTRFLCQKNSSSKAIYCYGGTENNKKEFNFLEQKARSFGFPVEFINIKDLNYERVRSIKSDIKDLVKAVFIEFFLRRGVVSRSVLHQGVAYALSVLSAHETLSKLEGRLFVVANDHAPEPVAYAKIASYLGARVAYVQHAEVTEIFPALDFEYSILRNKASYKTYSKKGISGLVAYSSRSGCVIDPCDIIESRRVLKYSKSLKVIVYPSSVFNKNKLCFLVSQLKLNPFISGVFVKAHPAYKDRGFFKDQDISVLDSHYPEKHIAICGNSSVVIDLVRSGNLVFNYFSLDDIEPDYYGFVSKGLSHKFDIALAGSCFWSDVSESDPLHCLGEYFPEVSTPGNNLQLYRLKELFISMFSTGGVTAKKAVWFERDVFALTSTFLSLLRSRKKTPYDDFFVINSLNLFFDHRDARLNSLYKHADLDCCSSVFEFWLNTKVIEWNGRVPTSRQLSLLVEFLTGGHFDKKTRSWLSVKCFDVLLRFGEGAEVLSFLRSGASPLIKSLGINKKIAFLNYANEHKSYREKLSEFYKIEGDDSLTPLDKLKIFVQAGLRANDLPVCGDFREVERLFMAYHPRVEAEYRSHVCGPYSAIGERACFVDVKRDPVQEVDLVNLIKERLVAKIGFSFIRLSDGEGFIFHRMTDFFTVEDSRNRQRHWWGEEIDSLVIDELLDDLIVAVRGADLLGIPSVYRFIRDHSSKSHSLSQNLQGRGLLSVLAAVRQFDSPDKLYTDDKANIAVFNKIEVIVELAKLSEKVLVINSGSADSVRDAFCNHFDFVHIKVPTHNKTSLNNRYYGATRPLPYVYKEVLRELESHVVPGALVLVGAGVAGKVFMHAAKVKGAVALDLGSAMDQFLGGGIHSLF